MSSHSAEESSCHLLKNIYSHIMSISHQDFLGIIYHIHLKAAQDQRTITNINEVQYLYSIIQSTPSQTTSSCTSTTLTLSYSTTSILLSSSTPSFRMTTTSLIILPRPTSTTTTSLSATSLTSAIHTSIHHTSWTTSLTTPSLLSLSPASSFKDSSTTSTHYSSTCSN